MNNTVRRSNWYNILIYCKYSLEKNNSTRIRILIKNWGTLKKIKIKLKNYLII